MRSPRLVRSPVQLFCKSIPTNDTSCHGFCKLMLLAGVVPKGVRVVPAISYYHSPNLLAWRDGWGCRESTSRRRWRGYNVEPFASTCGLLRSGRDHLLLLLAVVHLECLLLGVSGLFGEAYPACHVTSVEGVLGGEHELAGSAGRIPIFPSTTRPS